MDCLRKRLAAFIKKKRGTVSQKTFARTVGVAQSTIMRIECESQNVTIDTLEKLCLNLNCNIEDLFEDPSK